MACVALASLKATIKLEFLQPIPRVPLHDQPPIQSFFEMISSLQAFLDESSGGGAATKDLEIKIRDFALKAEDNIEIQLRTFVLAKDREYREKASQKLHQTLQEAAENATELLNIIHSTSNEADDEDNETQPPIHGLKHASESENDKWDGSSWRSPELAGRMVGHHHERRETIINFLTLDSDKLNLISIVGMVGIGKTTLAKSVYEDPKVENHFDVRGWITMPQEYNKSQTLRLLLRSISPAAENGSAPEEIERQVRSHLFGKKYLIVFDNIQDNRAWNDIRICFPDDGNGSRILLTTGHFNLNFNSSSYVFTLHMTLLDPKESWDLFCNILSLKECMEPEFEKIRSHIVEICDGLPLSIVAVAKRLSKCNNILKEWEKIKKEIESLGILDRNTLTFQYNQLPQELKVCFLYLGVFPKCKEILVKNLIGLWIAEGFLKPLEHKKLENQGYAKEFLKLLESRENQGNVKGFLKSLEHKKLENQGYAYLKELINRSLVLICNRSSDGKIKTCRMHSALHSFCVGESQKQGIFCAINTLQHSGVPLSEFANSCRWLSLYTHCFDYYVLFTTNNPRSIFFFDDDPKSFVPFKMLRVLAFVPSPFLQRVSMHLGDLVFLRYLSITQRFEGLGNIVSLIPNLQTLIVFGDEPQIGAPIIHLPSRICELPQLRHLELGDMYTVDPPSMVNEKLETLSWVSPTHCGAEVYNFPNLRKLKIFYKEDLESSQSHGSSCNPIILDNLGHLKWLERLTISISVGCTITLPEWRMFPLQFEKLRLSGTILSERDLMVIGMLPKLRVLKLENVFLRRVWKVTKGEFSELRFLLLEDKGLKQLLVECRSFPCLKHLVLRFCYCLEKIPNEFALSPLKSIELDRCNPSVVASAKLIQKMLRTWRRSLELKIDGAEYLEPQYAEESLQECLAKLINSELTSTRQMECKRECSIQ